MDRVQADYFIFPIQHSKEAKILEHFEREFLPVEQPISGLRAPSRRLKASVLGSLRKSFLLMLLISSGANLHAACTGEGFMGVTSRDPVMSVVDLTFSPVYSSSTTSGTSGCQNWDFALLLLKEREKFVRIRHQGLLEQSSAGQGTLLEAWSKLMSCPNEVQPRFNRVLRSHFPEAVEVLNSPEREKDYPRRVQGWILQDPVLRAACNQDELS